ncbi:J domain-containing protein [Rugamonas sp. DEMB1]|uniref:J domain-containing protein n=1 Tax=Rugamonas sp. DEMB1 TaxID=3039386 RepID=UPI00244CDF9E|nr:J domain-containing protein [Rugamonas sp. DEMB1]WGG50193.1 DnaJ domain-containing protein [Rugamonas sp. DEMB1]
MGKIHTHYDNLKVSRMAPQEVIRAAYKALSQKYHPDKNPGDEKAARIMAILNSAYGTLSDQQRRKEHDEWIAAEEWEIEWLESTRQEEGRHRGGGDGPAQAWADDDEARMPRPRRRNWPWWLGLAVCLGLGWTGGALMVAEPRQVATLLASAWDGKAAPAGGARAEGRAEPSARPEPRLEPKAEAPPDGWAVAKPYSAEASTAKMAPIKVVALSQIVLPGAAADCEAPSQTLMSPNGEPWPTRSGYIDGFPVGNKGEDMQLTLDNAGNASAVFIKVYDMERHSNVRYAFVQAHDKLVVDQLASGKYEIRYQNLDIGAEQAGCEGQRKTATASN